MRIDTPRLLSPAQEDDVPLAARHASQDTIYLREARKHIASIGGKCGGLLGQYGYNKSHT